jgi:hypothetical protein
MEAQTVNLQLIESLIQAIRSLSPAEQRILDQKLHGNLPSTPEPSPLSPPPTTGQSLLRLSQKYTADMSADEINQLPADAAQNHDHYLYGTGER